jgi:hypothetical protein
MRKHLAALAAALPFVVAGAAQADGSPAPAPGPWYAEIGYTRTELTSKDSDVGASLTAGLNTVDARVGAQFAKHWGAEMEFGTGLGSTNTNINFSGGGSEAVSVKMNWQVGVYVLGYWPIAKGLDVFGRAGAVGAEFHENFEGSPSSNNEHGWAVGAGVRWFPGDGRNGVRVEYTRYGLQDDANNFGVHYVRRF